MVERVIYVVLMDLPISAIPYLMTPGALLNVFQSILQAFCLSSVQ